MERGDASHRGLGLIELLVAMALGLTLAAGVIQVYVGNSQAARDLQARIRVQENGRLALRFLTQALRATASSDCSTEQWLALSVAGLSALPIRGWEAEGTAPGDVPNRDGSNLAVVDSHQGGWQTSTGEKMARFSLLPGSDVIQIRDPCVPGATFAMQSQNDNGTHGTLFYIGKRGNAADNPPALFRRSVSGSTSRAEELFEGVASLQLLYGVERDDDMRYVVANQVDDWQRVRSLRISLLLQSVEDHLLAPQPYVFNGVHYGAAGNAPPPGDGRLRRVFTTTLAWRARFSNPGPPAQQPLLTGSIE